MKILHTGDIHLDSPFSGVSAAEAERSKRELRQTFTDMMRYARENLIDLVLISGDVFDCGFATRETAAILCEGFELAGCPVVISPGNHDPYTEDSIWKRKALPDNVYIFDDSELSCFEFDAIGARVYGWAFRAPTMKENPLDGKSAERDGKVNLLLAHCDTADLFSNYCPISPASITAFGADYAALGHIHSPEAANAALEAKGISSAYCGCPQGRDIGESGIKGAYVVTIDALGCRREFVPFCKKLYAVEEVKVDGAETAADIISEVRTVIARGGYGENTVLRVYLRGFAANGLVILCDDIAREAGEGLCALELKDETVPSLGSEELMHDRGIRGEVYRLLLPKIESGSPAERDEAILALRYALAALTGQPLI